MADYTFDDEGNPIRRVIESYADQFADEDDVTNIFDVKGHGFDVTLSLSSGMLCWVTVNPAKAKKFKGQKPYGKGKHTGGKFELPLDDILGVKIKRLRGRGQKEGEGLCKGFTVLTYELFGPNCLKEKLVDFEHPSESICRLYYEGIKKYISGLDRPKSVKIFLQAYAGSRESRKIYREKVLPLMQDAELNIDCTEVLHNEHIKQDMVHLNLDDYDCMVAMGGDTTANKVAAGLLTASQVIRDIEIKNGFTPVKASMPLGIIPTGAINHIAKSVMGIVDPVTAVIHIILGHKQPVDVCSAFKEDHLIHWSFIAQYGYVGNVLRYATSLRNKAVPKYIQASLARALKPSKLTSYECDIEYIPAEKQESRHRCLPCRTGCDMCLTKVVEEEEEVEEECVVQPFDQLAESNNSDNFVDLSKEEGSNPWKKIKGSFMNVGLFCIPGNCNVAPLGLSKYTHLNDGCMELVLVKDVLRKDFLRFVKRHVTPKNQFGFDFVNVIRVKEVKFRPRYSIGWNFDDHHFNEVEYRMRKLSKAKSKSETILDMEEEDKVNDGKVSQSLASLDDLSEDSDDLSDSFDVPIGSRNSSANSDKKQYKINNNVILNTAPQEKDLVGPQYRMTFAEEERLKRKNKAIKKEEKKKRKEQKKMRSSWNIDNDICMTGELDFKQVVTSWDNIHMWTGYGCGDSVYRLSFSVSTIGKVV